MFILGGLVLTGCAVKSPTTAILEHKEKKVNQTIVEIPKWYKKLPNKKDIIFGIDNLNTYYDISLKRNRLKILKQNSK